MMGVASGEVIDVQGYQSVVYKALEKFLDQIDIEFANSSPRKLDVKCDARASGEIHHHAR